MKITQKFRGALQGSDLKSQLLRGGIGSAVIQALNRVLALATGVLLARALGAEGYGVYVYAFAILSLLMVVAEAGVPTLLMREVAAAQGREEWGLLRGALTSGGQLVAIAATAVAACGMLILWGLADGLGTDQYRTLTIMLLLLPVTALGKVVAHALRGLHLVVMGQALELLLRPAVVLIILGLVYFTWPELRNPQVAMAVQLLGAFLVMLLSCWLLLAFIPAQVRSHAPEHRYKRWLKSALPFTLIGGASIINSQADIIMLGWYRSSAEVGIYRVATQGGVFVWIVLQVFHGVLPAHFSKLYSSGQLESLRALFRKVTILAFLLTLPIALILIFFGEPIISIVFGLEFAAAALPLAILATGYLGNVFFGPVGLLLQMTGKEKTTASVLWMTVVLNILLNAALIPSYGASGGAFATAVSVFTYHGVLRYVAFRQLSI